MEKFSNSTMHCSSVKHHAIEANWPCGKPGSLAETGTARRWIRLKPARPKVFPQDEMDSFSPPRTHGAERKQAGCACCKSTEEKEPQTTLLDASPFPIILQIHCV